MLKRREQEQEAIEGPEEVRKYAQQTKRFARLMYGPMLKDIKRLGISGDCLEMGAGPGVLAAMLAESHPGVAITAVDLSADMAAIAEEHIMQKGLPNRIRYIVADVQDTNAMLGLGKFDLVYSTFSLHHWKDPEASIANLWDMVKDNGMLYIYDFKRVWWLYVLPLKGGDIGSIRAAYTRKEIAAILQRLGIANYRVKTLFPFFLQSVTAWK